MAEKLSSRVYCIIPARWASSRFPGKPLHLLAGKPLIRWVWEQCQEATRVDRILVATDDQRIFDVCQEFGAETVMTSSKCPSGTDRIAEVLQIFPEATHAVNVQGDEPFVDPALIDRIVDMLQGTDHPEIVTAANPITSLADFLNPNIVKVVCAKNGDALYFSRSPIPCNRENPEEALLALRHHGIYGYSRDLLLRFVQWPPSPLEQCEALEQLRALEHGVPIKVAVTQEVSLGIDTPQQAAEAEKLLIARQFACDSEPANSTVTN